MGWPKAWSRGFYNFCADAVVLHVGPHVRRCSAKSHETSTDQFVDHFPAKLTELFESARVIESQPIVVKS